MLPNNNKMLQKNFFWISAFFGRFLTKKQPKKPLKNPAKIDKNEENWQNPNCSMKFSETWYVDASQQKNTIKKLFLEFGLFWSFFTKKQPKLTKMKKIGKIKPFDEIF